MKSCYEEPAVHAAMPPRCVDCAEASASAFSQRMLRRTHGAVRCKACVTIGEQAERAAAASRQATAAEGFRRVDGEAEAWSELGDAERRCRHVLHPEVNGCRERGSRRAGGKKGKRRKKSHNGNFCWSGVA